MNKITREKKTIDLMVGLYCRRKLGLATVPEEYQDFLTYAHARLDRCRFGERKTSCKRCPVHCYSKPRREQARRIMRWCGPRMFLYAPLAALRHLIGR